MTSSDRFDRDLHTWLQGEAPGTGPVDLHSAAIATIGARRQRPAWLVALRGGTFGQTAAAIRPALGTSRLVILLALLIAAMSVAAVLGSAVFSDPLRPTARNGSIAYSVFENGQRSRGQHSGRHIVAADGTWDRRIGYGTCLTYSADGGSFIYRSDWNSNEVVVEAADASWRITVFGNDDSWHPSWRPYALSPDGNMIAWVKPLEPTSSSRNEVWVTPVHGGISTRIFPASPVSDERYWNPSWSPDSRTIAFEGHLTSGDQVPRTAIYLVDVDGSGVRRLTTRPAMGDTRGPSWSPDGRSIAYLGLDGGEAVAGRPLDVFIIGVDGSGDRNVTNSAAFDRRPEWSPDGRRVAFLTGDAPADGSDSRLAVVDVGAPDMLRAPLVGPPTDAFTWSPDGTQLVSIRGNDLRTLDVQFRAPMTTLAHVASTDGGVTFSIEIACQPSWQRLDP